MASVHLRPLPSVIDVDGTWTHTPLGITLPAPPRRVDASSSAGDLACAVQALDYGLASATLRLRLRPRLRLRLREAAPSGAAASLMWALLQGVQLRCRARDLMPGRARALVQTTALLTGHAAPWLAVLSALFAAAWAAGSLLGMVLAAVPIAVYCSVVIHEWGHVIAYRVLGGPDAPGIFVVRLGHTSLIRPVLDDIREVVVICAGPFAPMLAALLLNVVPGMPLPLRVGAVALAAAHPLGLLLPFGDGANIRTYLSISGKGKKR